MPPFRLVRARVSRHAAEPHRAGVIEAVPDTMAASLHLSGAVLVEPGLAMGPMIASIHEKRTELRDGVADETVALRRW